MEKCFFFLHWMNLRNMERLNDDSIGGNCYDKKIYVSFRKNQRRKGLEKRRKNLGICTMCRMENCEKRESIDMDYKLMIQRQKWRNYYAVII